MLGFIVEEVCLFYDVVLEWFVLEMIFEEMLGWLIVVCLMMIGGVWFDFLV